MGRFGSPFPYIIITSFQLVWTLSVINPFKFMFSIPFSAVTTFKISQKKVYGTLSSDCKSQYAMVISTVIHIASYCRPVLQTFDMVKHNTRILYVLPDLHFLYKLHTITCKVYKDLENKQFVLWLPWESTTMNELESRIIFECHNSIYSFYSTMQKTLDPDIMLQQFGDVRVLNLSMITSKSELTKWWPLLLAGDLRR